ncbi:Inactive phospholipase C-like protein 2 [Portunus trituberculatus]|uniref:Inactive phospholipase C-like protein 2 n=1 Tax=Portunus trituberculatus TaxID=210409 RepID=A0A5B7JGM7_PORTR|nr:Inactive phospholipase C-like protein 2 [Portunus trituberculatus]
MKTCPGNEEANSEVQVAYDCLQYMIEGSSMVKLRANSRQYHRFFRLLDDLSAIRWTPTTKKTSKAQRESSSSFSSYSSS